LSTGCQPVVNRENAAGDIQARITASEGADDDNGDDQTEDTAEPMKKSLFSRIFGRKQ